MYYREKWYLIKGALTVVIGVITFIVLLATLMAPTKNKQQSENDVSIPICTMDPTPTPMSQTPMETRRPMTPDELSYVEKVKKPKKAEKFKAIKNCPWSKATQKKIANICNKKSISFELLMSMAYTESRYNETAVGDGGKAYGAWQIHPTVWGAVINDLGYDNVDMYKVIPAATVTAHIMRAHFEQYDDIEYAVMAWNGGGRYSFSMIDAGRTSQYAREIIDRTSRYEKR